MLDFIRKSFLWNAWDRGIHNELAGSGGFHFKSIQDLAVYDRMRYFEGRTIGEVGGGNSRVLRTLVKKNRCYNIERFNGRDGGPAEEICIDGVENIRVYLGEFSDEVPDSHFDCLFSVSVIEHVPSTKLDDFLKDGMRALKPGGLWIHAIDMYLHDEPTRENSLRFEKYVDWFSSQKLRATGEIFPGPVQFKCDMASNPDNTMYAWGRIAPSLIGLRQVAQSVSIILVGQRV